MTDTITLGNGLTIIILLFSVFAILGKIQGFMGSTQAKITDLEKRVASLITADEKQNEVLAAFCRNCDQKGQMKQSLLDIQVMNNKQIELRAQLPGQLAAIKLSIETLSAQIDGLKTDVNVLSERIGKRHGVHSESGPDL